MGTHDDDTHNDSHTPRPNVTALISQAPLTILFLNIPKLPRELFRSLALPCTPGQCAAVPKTRIADQGAKRVCAETFIAAMSYKHLERRRARKHRFEQRRYAAEGALTLLALISPCTMPFSCRCAKPDATSAIYTQRSAMTGRTRNVTYQSVAQL